MAKIIVEVDTETKAITVTLGGTVIEGVNCASIWKYSDCCEVSFEKIVKQDGITISKRYSACASQGQPLEVKENDNKKIESAAGYFKKVIK